MTATSNVKSEPAGRAVSTPLIALMIWHLAVGTALIYPGILIFQAEGFFRFGTVVPQFLGTLVAASGILTIATGVGLLLQRPAARLASMGVNVVGAVMALLYLGHLLGLYIGIDAFAAGLARNVWALLGLPIGYGVFWLSWRFKEGTQAREVLTRIGVFTAIAALIVILWSAGLVEGIVAVVGAFFSLQPIGATGLQLPLAPITLIVAGVFAAVFVVVMRMGERFGETTAQRESWQGWMFLMPNLISFTLFFAGPLLLSLYLSFTNYGQGPVAEFTAFENYTRLFSLSISRLESAEQSPRDVMPALHIEMSRFQIGEDTYVLGGRDPQFWRSLGNTAFYCLMLLPLSVIPALGLALLLNAKLPGMQIFRAIYFIPSIAAVVGVAVIWQWLYHPTIGYINYSITQFVTFMNTTFGLQMQDPQIVWLSEALLLFSVVIMAAWQSIGFNAVIFLAGLQGVPKELHEAATVDGAGTWKRFTDITLPLLAPTTFFVIVTTLISGLQAFAEPYILGPIGSAARTTTVIYLYEASFDRSSPGYASAVAWSLFIVIFAITLIQFRFTSRATAYED